MYEHCKGLLRRGLLTRSFSTNHIVKASYCGVLLQHIDKHQVKIMKFELTQNYVCTGLSQFQSI